MLYVCQLMWICIHLSLRKCVLSISPSNAHLSARAKKSWHFEPSPWDSDADDDDDMNDLLAGDDLFSGMSPRGRYG